MAGLFEYKQVANARFTSEAEEAARLATIAMKEAQKSEKETDLDALQTAIHAEEVRKATGAALSAELQALSDKLAQEIIDRSNGDIDAINGFADKLLKETQARESAISSISNRITTEVLNQTNERNKALAQEVLDRQAAITGEATERANAINKSIRDAAAALKVEENARIADIASVRKEQVDGDTAIARELDKQVTSIKGNIAQITKDVQTRTSVDEAFARDIKKIETKVDNSYSAITAEQQARSDADSAMASEIKKLQSINQDTVANYDKAIQVLTSQQQAHTQEFVTLTSKVNDNIADIKDEQLTRATAVDTLTKKTDTLSTQMADNAASIQREEQARSSADLAITSRLDTLQSTTDSNTAAINAETKARTDADTAIVNDVQKLNTSVNNNAASIVAERQARTTAVDTLTSETNKLSATISDNTAAIQQEVQTRTSEAQATSQRIDALVTKADDTTTAITELQKAVSDGDSALASDIKNIKATIGNVTGELDNYSFDKGKQNWSAQAEGKDAPDNAVGKVIAVPGIGNVLNVATSKNTGIYYGRAIPVQTDRTYRLRVRVRQTKDSTYQLFGAGVTCLDTNYTFLKGSSQYVIIPRNLKTKDGWQEFEGTITGVGTSEDNFHEGTVFAKPMFSTQSGIVQVDFLEFIDITDAVKASAELNEEKRVRAEKDAQLSQSITSLTSRVGNSEKAIEASKQEISTVKTELDNKAEVSDLTQLQARVRTTEGDISSNKRTLSTLTTDVSGKAQASDLEALKVRVTSTEGNVSSVTDRMTKAEADIGGKASAQSVNNLSTRVADTEKNIASTVNRVTVVEGDLKDKASVTDVNQLESKVNTVENTQSAISKQVANLETNMLGAATATEVSKLAVEVTNVVNSLPNYDFEKGLVGWSRSDAGKVGADNLDSRASIQTAAGEGQVFQTNSGLGLFAAKAIPVDTSRKYRMRARVRTIKDSSGSKNGRNGLYIGVNCLDSNYRKISSTPYGTYRYFVHQGGHLRKEHGWVNYEGIITGEGNDGYTKFRPGTAYVKPLLLLSHTGNGTVQVSYITWEDVTEEEANKASVETEKTARIEEGKNLAASIQSVRTSLTDKANNTDVTNLVRRMDTAESDIRGKASTQSVNEVKSSVSNLTSDLNAANQRINSTNVELGKKATSTQLNQVSSNVNANKANIDRLTQTVNTNTSSTATQINNLTAKVDSIDVNGGTLYTVVSQGFNSTPIMSRGLYQGDKAIFQSSRGFCVSIYEPTSKAWSSKSFDVLKSTDNAKAMADYIKTATTKQTIVIHTYDEPATNRLSGGLEDVMYSIGASETVFGDNNVFKYRAAYILVGRKDLGKGNGLEAISKTGDAPDSWCALNFVIDKNGVVNFDYKGNFEELIETNKAAIRNEETARTTQYTGLAQKQTQLETSLAGKASSTTVNGALTRLGKVEGEINKKASAQDLTQLTATVNSNKSNQDRAIQANTANLTKVTAEVNKRATAASVNTLQTKVNQNTSDIQQEVKARTDADNALTQTVNSMVARVNAAEGKFENFSFESGVKGWSLNSSGEIGADIAEGSQFKIKKVIAATSKDYSGKVLEVSGSRWVYYGKAIPVDTSRKYKMRVKVRQTQDPTNGTNKNYFYAGVATLDANYNVQTSSPGTHRYFAATSQRISKSQGWHTYEGTITGEGNKTHNQFRSGTAYVKPMFICNFNGGNGKAEVAFIDFWDATDEVDNKTEINNQATASADRDTALGRRIDTVTAASNANKASITSEAKTRASIDSALGKRIDSVTSSVNTNRASITNLTKTVTDNNSSTASQITSLKSVTNNIKNTGLPYTKTIEVKGDANKYYPVYIKYGDQDLKRRIVVKRRYSEKAPASWNTATHKGALTLDISANFGGWGGTSYDWALNGFSQLYGKSFAGAGNRNNNIFFVIFLRGGGATYHIYSDQWLDDPSSGTSRVQIFYNGSKDLIWQSGNYKSYADEPRTKYWTTEEINAKLKGTKNFAGLSKVDNMSAAEIRKPVEDKLSAEISKTNTTITNKTSAVASSVNTLKSSFNSFQNSDGRDLTNNQVFNGRFYKRNSDNRPLGWYPTYTSNRYANIGYSSDPANNVYLSYGGDSSIGMCGTAFAINQGSQYRIRIKAKTNATKTSGFYFRIAEYDGVLPINKVAVGHDKSSSEVQQNTRQITKFCENQPISASWRTNEWIYTPSASARYASPLFLNWSGMGINPLYIEYCEIIEIPAEARISTVAKTVATTDGKLNSTYSLFVSGGRVAGMKLGANKTSSTITFNADTFRIYNGSKNESPFRVSGGKTYIQDAVIANASIAGVKIRNGTITGQKLANATITNSKIGGYIASDNYVAGKNGWKLDKKGTIELNTGHFRGTVYADRIDGDVVTSKLFNKPFTVSALTTSLSDKSSTKEVLSFTVTKKSAKNRVIEVKMPDSEMKTFLYASSSGNGSGTGSYTFRLYKWASNGRHQLMDSITQKFPQYVSRSRSTTEYNYTTPLLYASLPANQTAKYFVHAVALADASRNVSKLECTVKNNSKYFTVNVVPDTGTIK